MRRIDRGAPVRAGSIKGWEQAEEEARGALPDLPYEAAAAVVLPFWPKSARATVDLAQDLALFFMKHAHDRKGPMLTLIQGGQS